MFLFFTASSTSVEKMKPLKNFTMSRENMRATLKDFLAGRSVADVTREVFHAISPPVADRTTPPAPASSQALVLAPKGSRSVASKASTQGRTTGSSKSPAAPKPKLTSTPASQEPITIEESVEGGSKEGAEVAPSPKQSKQAAAADAIVIRGSTRK